MEEENKGKKEKRGFFTDVWKSVAKVEEYPEMAARGFRKAIIHITELVLMLAVIISLCTMFKIYQKVTEGVNYLENEFPNFSYKDEMLDVQSEESITISKEEDILGKIIIDTKAENEETINKYIDEIEKNGKGIIILKDKVILKNISIAGNINYEYKDVFSKMGVNEFNKEDIIEYAKGAQVINLYIYMFFSIFTYMFMIYFIITLKNAFLLSLFGYITTLLTRIKMRYVAIFNMSVYALTLSVILNIIYIAINIFTVFNIQYFDVMYIAVAAIYLMAAIFILKTEFIKKQAELMKIAQVQESVKKELEQQEEEKKREEEKEKRKEKDREEEKKEKENKNDKREDKDDSQNGEPEGTNA